jgi:uncharacterized caspase-like protein
VPPFTGVISEAATGASPGCVLVDDLACVVNTSAFFVLVALLFLPWQASAEYCKADVDHPVRVCFTGVEFNRCKRAIIPHFYIDLYDWNRRYLYTVNIYKGAPRSSNLKPYSSTEPQKRTGLPPKDLLPFVIAKAGETAINGVYTVEVEAEYEDDHKINGTESKTIAIEYKPRVRAVIVGVSKYDKGKDDKPTSDLPITDDKPITNLYFAASDAIAFRDLLVDFFPKDSPIDFTPILLVDRDATKDRLRHELTESRGEAACDGDLFIFYFSGHTFASIENATRWLGTVDVDPDPIKIVKDGLSYDELFRIYLSDTVIKADKLLFFDSCFSGLTVSQDDASFPSTSSEITEADQGKMEVVDMTGQLRRDMLPQQPNAQEQREMVDELVQLGSSASVFAATNIDRQAQEGVVVTQSSTGRNFMFPDESKPSPTSTGHGLFTYALFVALEKQMAAAHRHPDFAADGLADHYWSTGKCQLNFKRAMEDATRFVEDIQQTRNKPVQELFYWKPLKDPKAIHCPKDAHN